jgi:hypothetical protein
MSVVSAPGGNVPRAVAYDNGKYRAVYKLKGL